MTDNGINVTALQQRAKTQREIEAAITRMFAPEDDGLRQALIAAKEAGLPQIQISPIQGKLLQLLAIACNARNIMDDDYMDGFTIAVVLPESKER